MQKGAKIYAVVSQFVVEMLVLIASGILLGKYVFHDEILGGILAAVGAILGIGLFIIYLYRLGDKLGRQELGKQEGRTSRKRNNTDDKHNDTGGPTEEESEPED